MPTTDELSTLIAEAPAPDWLKSRRETGLARFGELGLPTPRDEEWKYTNLRPIMERSLHLPQAGNADFNQAPCFRAEDITITLIDGRFSPEYSEIEALPTGVHITPFADGGDGYPGSEHVDDAFCSLNRAAADSGVSVRIDDGVNCQRPIHIQSINGVSGKSVLTSPAVSIFLGTGAEAVLLESFTSPETSQSLTNALTDICLGANAILHYVKLQVEGLSHGHISTTRTLQERDSRLESFSLNIGSRLARQNHNIILNGPGIESRLDGLYLIRGDQHVDNHTTVDHRHPDCQSNQLYKGILDDKSRAVFNGKIFVRQAAQRTNAYQLNRNLLLNPKAHVDTKPQLEINADDVRCTHGATIGPMNTDEVFYLQSRGMDRERSIAVLSQAFAREVPFLIKNIELRGRTLDLITSWFETGT